MSRRPGSTESKNPWEPRERQMLLQRPESFILLQFSCRSRVNISPAPRQGSWVFFLSNMWMLLRDDGWWTTILLPYLSVFPSCLTHTMKVLEAKHEALSTAWTSVSMDCFLSGIYTALSAQRASDAIWILSHIYSSSPGERVVKAARTLRSAAPHRITEITLPSSSFLLLLGLKPAYSGYITVKGFPICYLAGFIKKALAHM